ncbi:MAG: 5-(carboxyamino)imidazole ribonucleotide synthase [Piscirickettsiaceae bacterium]|nr:5-(carboxyamino)imidazole ribonucleotide synthase [Piscirickettsiaceae bacterium]
MILPGATLGLLSGGQLGRMFTTAAQTMGYRVVVLDPDINSPAGIIADQHICAEYSNEIALKQLAKCCDAITTEFENIPETTLAFLEQKTIVRPSSKALAATQNRINEKHIITSLNIPVAPFIIIRSISDIENKKILPPFPNILKTVTFGYDGKSQSICQSREDVTSAFRSLGQVECVLEQHINFKYEISAVLARSEDGIISNFPIAKNVHINGMLHSTTVPSMISKKQAKKVINIANKIANSLNYIGVIAVEFFVSNEDKLFVNEIAPRPHNSGHFTLDACRTSQFEQQVRMLCGLPSGSCELLSPVVMINILGDAWGRTTPNWDKLLSVPQNNLHMYGKKEARIGRKMGHFNVLASTVEQATNVALKSFQELIRD